MKSLNKYLVCVGLSVLTTLSLSYDADAQRGGRGSGGGGSRGGSFGGGGGSRGGSFGGGGRSGGSFNGGSRPSFGGGSSQQRPSGGGFSQQRPNRESFGSRPGTSNRPNVGGNFGGNRGGFNSQQRGSYAYRGGAGRPGFSGRSSYNIRPGYRGNFGRSYFSGRSYYRGGVRGFYGRPYNGFYHYYGGYYNQFYYPRLGFGLSVLPLGYYPFYWGGYPYYYSNGFYYQQNNNQYTVVEPPVGAEINALPDNAEMITIDGTQYYEANGVYYLPVTKDNGRLVYRVAGKDGQLDTENGQQVTGTDNGTMPEIGDVIDELPDQSQKVKINGEKYYVTPDGVYLHEQRDSTGKKVYVVTGVPDNEPDDQQ